MNNYKKEALRALAILENIDLLLDEATAKHMLANEAVNKKAA